MHCRINCGITFCLNQCFIWGIQMLHFPYFFVFVRDDYLNILFLKLSYSWFSTTGRTISCAYTFSVILTIFELFKIVTKDLACFFIIRVKVVLRFAKANTVAILFIKLITLNLVFLDYHWALKFILNLSLSSDEIAIFWCNFIFINICVIEHTNLMYTRIF